MGKLKLQVQMSVNGCVAGENGEMDWMTWNWDEQLKAYVAAMTASVETILLGRKMTDSFISIWSAIRDNPVDPEHAFAKKMMDTPKVVFSKTLTESSWENTTIAKGNLIAAVQEIKDRDEKDIIVYGGAGFAASLINSGLIDEYYLFVNPAFLHQGKSIFSELGQQMQLHLKESIWFDCGIVLLCYTPEAG